MDEEVRAAFVRDDVAVATLLVEPAHRATCQDGGTSSFVRREWPRGTLPIAVVALLEENDHTGGILVRDYLVRPCVIHTFVPSKGRVHLNSSTRRSGSSKRAFLVHPGQM